MPSVIEEVHRQYKDRGLVVLAVNIEESADTVAAWVRAKRVSFPIVLDTSGRVTQQYRVTGTPTVFVVGRDGRLIGKAVGTKAWMSPPGRTLLDALVKS